MKLLLKLTIPDNLVKEIDQIADRLWPNKCWWDIIKRQLDNTAGIIGGKIEFVEIVRKKKWWRKKSMKY